jgi:C-terminal processing protease CtpA/Prc
MKTKHLITIITNLVLIGLLIIFKRLQVKDIAFVYLMALIPAFILSNIEYLFRRKQRYTEFMIKKFYVTSLITIFLLAAILFITQPKYFPKASAVSDLRFMVKTLESVHPDIYHVISKDSFSIKFSEEIETLPERITVLDFFKTCARLTSHFRTGHTRPMENLLVTKFLFGNAFPFQTKIIDDELYITHNLSLLSSIPVGSEIVEINNKSINQLIGEWSKLVSYENKAFRNHQITMPVNIGIWNDFKSYKIKYIDYNTRKEKEKVVNGGLASNIYASMKSKYKKPKELIYKEISPGVGYIGFFSCMDLENYEDFYKSTFSEIKNKGIEHLVIDIRDNGGGHNIITAWLEQYIFHQPHNDTDSAIVKVSNELIATGKVRKKLGHIKDVEAGKTYTLISGLRQIKELPLRYKGKTYLLTNNGTFSAAQGFASAYRCYGQGTIIGEETGGATLNFGDVHIFKLPNSGLKIMTSWEQVFSSCGIDNQRGVIPDFIVKNSIEDYINHTDRVIEFTLNLINDKK